MNVKENIRRKDKRKIFDVISILKFNEKFFVDFIN